MDTATRPPIQHPDAPAERAGADALVDRPAPGGIISYPGTPCLPE
jgi:hypothetical protein